MDFPDGSDKTEYFEMPCPLPDGPFAKHALKHKQKYLLSQYLKFVNISPDIFLFLCFYIIIP